MPEAGQQPRAHIDHVGNSSSEGRRVSITLEYDQITARIELPVTTPESDPRPGIEVYRQMLERLGWACREAVLSPHAISWPTRRDGT